MSNVQSNIATIIQTERSANGAPRQTVPICMRNAYTKHLGERRVHTAPSPAKTGRGIVTYQLTIFVKPTFRFEGVRIRENVRVVFNDPVVEEVRLNPNNWRR